MVELDKRRVQLMCLGEKVVQLDDWKEERLT